MQAAGRGVAGEVGVADASHWPGAGAAACCRCSPPPCLTTPPAFPAQARPGRHDGGCADAAAGGHAHHADHHARCRWATLVGSFCCMRALLINLWGPFRPVLHEAAFQLGQPGRPSILGGSTAALVGPLGFAPPAAPTPLSGCVSGCHARRAGAPCTLPDARLHLSSPSPLPPLLTLDCRRHGRHGRHGARHPSNGNGDGHGWRHGRRGARRGTRQRPRVRRDSRGCTVHAAPRVYMHAAGRSVLRVWLHCFVCRNPRRAGMQRSQLVVQALAALCQLATCASLPWLRPRCPAEQSLPSRSTLLLHPAACAVLRAVVAAAAAAGCSRDPRRREAG